MAADDFWHLCEFILDRLDGLSGSVLTRELVAAQRRLVTHAMVKVATAHNEHVSVAVYDLVKTLAAPFAGHPEFRAEWAVER